LSGFGYAPEVDVVPDMAGPEGVEVSGCEFADVGASVDGLPFYVPAVARGVAAEISEVNSAAERDVTDGAIGDLGPTGQWKDEKEKEKSVHEFVNERLEKILAKNRQSAFALCRRVWSKVDGAYLISHIVPVVASLPLYWD
jgi:hypothetical protein